MPCVVVSRNDEIVSVGGAHVPAGGNFQAGIAPLAHDGKREAVGRDLQYADVAVTVNDLLRHLHGRVEQIVLALLRCVSAHGAAGLRLRRVPLLHLRYDLLDGLGRPFILQQIVPRKQKGCRNQQQPHCNQRNASLISHGRHHLCGAPVPPPPEAVRRPAAPAPATSIVRSGAVWAAWKGD